MLFGREDKVPQYKLTIVQYAILAIFLVLVYGLWRLQVGGNQYYAKLAEQNRVRQIPILAPRGRILDREGRIIVDNYPSFSALLLRDQSKNLIADSDKIAAALHMDPDEVKKRITRFASAPSYQPLILKDDITPDELAFIESHKNELPELDTIMSNRRLYPKNGFMAHLIGYVGEINEDMLNQPQFEFYNPGDVVGMAGVEREYNDLLMGKNGSRNVIVNSRGKEMGELSETPAVPGQPLKLTIDLDLQIAAEEALGDKNGAIVAMDPRTGEVLAMASRPTFDPNAFAVRITQKEWNELISDPDKPLLNKAIQAQLAPGSTFKIVMSVAGLQEGIAENMHVSCHGGGTFYGRYFKCWQKGGHGMVDINKAIYQSCDTFFYTLAERLGIAKIAEYATALGFGQKTGIDLPQEVSGVMPSEEWKIKNFKQKWYAGETISVGIGQGAVAATPVQMMRAIGAITSGGLIVTPHVAFPGQFTGDYARLKPVLDERRIQMDARTWDTITDAMAEVVGPTGTAPVSHLEGIDFAGKTGSAQTISNAAKARLGDKGNFKDNGWFVGVTPRRNPDVVVAVLFQGGEHGALAARVAAQFIKAFVEKQRKRDPQLAQKYTPGTPENLAAISAQPGTTPGSEGKPSSRVTAAAQSKNIEAAGFWSAPGEDRDGSGMQGVRFRVNVADRNKQKAVAAPGLDAPENRTNQ